MMPKHVMDARYWHARAAEVRAKVDTAETDYFKRAMEDIAVMYDRQAAWAEEMAVRNGENSSS